jgi:hypothetical protein
MARSLAELIRGEFGFNTIPVDHPANVAVGVALVQVLPSNPSRVNVTFQNNGATTIYLKTNRDLIVGTGIRLIAGGGSISLKWNEDFDRIASAFWAIGSAGGGLLSIFEDHIYHAEREG